MKLFFPFHCLGTKSGFIFGWKNEQGNTFVAVTVIHPREIFDSFCARVLAECSSSLVGIWLNENDQKSVSQVFTVVKTLSRSLTDELIVLRLVRNTDIFQLYHVGGIPVGDRLTVNGSVVIFYKQPLGNAFLTTGPTDPNSNKFWRKSVVLQEQTCPTELSKVLVILNKSHKAEGSIYKLLETSNSDKPALSSHRFLYNLVLKALSMFYAMVYERKRDHHPVLVEMIKLFSRLSAVFLQMCTRFRQMHALIMCFNKSRTIKDKPDHDVYSTESRNSPSMTNGNPEKNTNVHVFPVVWFGSLLCTVGIDIILGLFVVSWLFLNGYNTGATDFMMEKTDTVVQWLNVLLDWLKGAPAGLKLNKQLAEWLSTFFLYHIYLWQIYLSCIEPYLQIIISLIIMSGCFGVTFLLSLASDVLSIVTLHIYCFYVYAARLYNFQLQKLLMLAKLFTGRKWNVEKNQEDIVPYKADRLFLGTLCFTVLLFLLPTTAMYYVVFTALRLTVLFVKGVVSRAIDVMNNLPLFALITAFFRPDLIPGGVKFEFVDSSDPPGTEIDTLWHFPTDITGPLPAVCLILHNQPLPITDLLHRQLLDKYPDHEGYQLNWMSLLGKLAKGELIYPWVKPKTFKKDAAH